MSASHTPESRPPINYVFVDYENVPGADLTVIDDKTVYLTLLLGPRQTKLDVDLVETLLGRAASVQLVRLAAPGKNALDFTLAYHLGRAVQADPNAYFHIVSKDKGFDPLIEHLKCRHIRVMRHDDCSAITFSRPAKQPALKETQPIVPSAPTLKTSAPTTKVSAKKEQESLLADAVEQLRKQLRNSPKTMKSLKSHLTSHLGKKVASDAEASSLITQLIDAKHIEVDAKGKVTYHMK
jgi:hypothetical protein